jgi:hypothetical protein
MFIDLSEVKLLNVKQELLQTKPEVYRELRL